MSIASTDMIVYKSQLISTTTPSQNGGRMSTTAAPDNTKGNCVPDTTNSQRVSGSVVRAKMFHAVQNANDIPLLNAKIYIEAPETGDQYYLLRPGGFTDTEDQLGSARCYGLGTLNAAVAQGATSLVMTLEHPNMAAQAPFQNGDMVRLSNMVGVTGAGSEEFVTLAASNAVSVGSNGVVTLTLAAPGTSMAWNPASATVKVASVWQIGTVQPIANSSAVTSSNGSYNFANLVPKSVGGIEQNWTLTITNNTTGAFRLDGDTLGSGVATGSWSSDFSPNNPSFSAPYFVLKAAGWGGTWSNGDQIKFHTCPAAVGVWYEQNTPANAASTAAAVGSIAFVGESAS